MKWFRISRWSWKPMIDAVEVERVTEHFVYVNGRRQARGDFFQTWEEAKAEMVREARRKVEAAATSLAHAQKELAEREAMQP